MDKEFYHKAIYGATKTGKTWLCKRLANKLRNEKQKVIVYSAAGDTDWPKGCQFFFQPDLLEAALDNSANFGAHVFLDEGQVLYQNITEKSHPIIYYMGTMGRHKGYTMYVATQRPQRIPTHVRENCLEVYCFALGGASGRKIVEDDYGTERIKQILGASISDVIHNLPHLHYLRIKVPAFAQLGKLT